jgi:hypothetical protein
LKGWGSDTDDRPGVPETSEIPAHTTLYLGAPAFLRVCSILVGRLYLSPSTAGSWSFLNFTQERARQAFAAAVPSVSPRLQHTVPALHVIGRPDPMVTHHDIWNLKQWAGISDVSGTPGRSSVSESINCGVLEFLEFYTGNADLSCEVDLFSQHPHPFKNNVKRKKIVSRHGCSAAKTRLPRRIGLRQQQSSQGGAAKTRLPRRIGLRTPLRGLLLTQTYPAR